MLEETNKMGILDVIAAIKTAAGSDFSMSFFVPAKKGGYILDAAFLYGMGDFSPVRTRPFASVLIEPDTGTMVEYCNACIRDFVDSGQYPMWKKIDYTVPYAKSAREQGGLVNEVNELYKSIREFPWKDNLNEDEKTKADRYRSCFYKAVPKALLPFYQGLSPEFFRWLAGAC